MAELRDIVRRVRMEIGDPPQPFRSTGIGDAQTVLYDLPKQQLCEDSLQVVIVNGAVQTELTDYTSAQPWNSTTAYTVGTSVTYQQHFYTCLTANTGTAPAPGGNADWSDVTSVAYTVNSILGKIILAEPVALNAVLIVTGTSWALFSDRELAELVMESVLQHTYAQEMPERYRDAHGFISFRETPKMLLMLPAIEVPLIVMLSVINTFWVLANDAATDANINTAEGTNVDRTTRYEHLMAQIAAMKDRYTEYCGQINVGLYRWETLNLRRTSRTTGRLVPGYKSQEYDDRRWPQREIHPIDHRDGDNSGVPSPLWAPNWGSA